MQDAVAEATQSDYVYDSRNRLLACNGVLYSYDAEDNRGSLTYSVGGVLTRCGYVYNRSGELPEVLIRNKSIDGGADSSAYYVYGAGLEYEVSFNSDGTEKEVRYYHADQVGSTIALSDDTGRITDKFSYDTWGYVERTLGTSDTPFLYVGAFGVQTDPNDLVNMRARYYNPTTKTFISADPLGFGGGMNWYQYASGNPLTRVDPNGMYDGSAFANDGNWNNLMRSMHTDNAGYYLSMREQWNSPLGVAARILIPFMESMAQTQMGDPIAARSSLNADVLMMPLTLLSGASKVAVSTIKVASAVSKTAVQVAKISGNAVARVATSIASRVTAKMNAGAGLVRVTSWASKGTKPDLNPGRWVMKGGPSLINYLLTGLSGPKITLSPLSVAKPNHSINNFITSFVPESSLKWPKGWEKIKGLFGQRIIE